MISQLRSLVLSNPEDEGGFGSQQEMTPCPETATTHQLRHTLCASSDPVRTQFVPKARAVPDFPREIAANAEAGKINRRCRRSLMF